MTAVFMNVWSLFLKGGPMMWPLLVLSVLSMAIIIERWLAFVHLRRSWIAARDRILALVYEAKLKEAVVACDQAPALLGRVLKVGILTYGANRESLLKAMEQAMLIESADLYQRMSLLGVIVNLAPLLGLLATTTGLTVVFHAVHMRSNALNPLALGDMSSGIWQALVSTSMGLGVGIMAFVGHAFLTHVIQDIVNDTQDSMVTVSHTLVSLWEGDHARA